MFDAVTLQHLQTIPVGKDINSNRIQDVALDGNVIVATTQNGDGENWTHHRITLKATGKR